MSGFAGCLKLFLKAVAAGTDEDQQCGHEKSNADSNQASDNCKSEYRLAKTSGLSDSTIKNIFKWNTQPTIETLETICRAFGITLSQFFADE